MKHESPAAGMTSDEAQDHSSALGRLNDRFHLQQRLTDAVEGSGGSPSTRWSARGPWSSEALVLAIFVAVLDLVPIVGSPLAGIVTAAVALTVSFPVCIATVAFFIVFRLLEDYLLIPRIIGRAVRVPGLITVVAVLFGGALLGIVGALVAIPIAAALLLLTQEVLYPRLDEI